MGTWIAGVSVAIVAMSKGLSEINFLLSPLFWLNVVFWVIYIGLTFRDFMKMAKEESKVVKAHGGILLSCVATQSIVISGKTLYGKQFPTDLGTGLMVFGLILYSVGMFFILTGIIKRSRYSIK